MRSQSRIPTCLVRSAGALLLALVAVGLLAAPAGARTGPGDGGRNRRIALGAITVDPGETVDGPLVGIDGRATIAGTVDGSAFVVRGDLRVLDGGLVDGNVVVLRGDAVIEGRVNGNVVAVRGRVFVRSGGIVHGDVRSTDTPFVAHDARVTGEVARIDVVGILTAVGIGLLVFWWIAVTLSTAVLGFALVAVLPRAVEEAATLGRSRETWWRALLAGLGLIVGLPIVGFLALATVVGFPLGLGVLGALGVVHALGYVTGGYFLGRLILPAPRNRFGAFALGWGILRLVAILPAIGVLVWLAAATYGIGMLAVAAFLAGRNPRPVPTTPSAKEG